MAFGPSDGHLREPISQYYPQQDPFLTLDEPSLFGHQLLSDDPSVAAVWNGIRYVSPGQTQFFSPFPNALDHEVYLPSTYTYANATSPSTVAPVVTPGFDSTPNSHSSGSLWTAQTPVSDGSLQHQPHATPETLRKSVASGTGRGPVTKSRRGRPRKDVPRKTSISGGATSSQAEIARPGRSAGDDSGPVPGSATSLHGGDEDADKEDLLERNRVAATKFRCRKRLETKELVTDERDLEANYERLVATHGELKNEVVRLKGLLLEHGHCDCELIRTYLHRECQNIVGRAGSDQTDATELRRACLRNESS